MLKTKTLKLIEQLNETYTNYKYELDNWSKKYARIAATPLKSSGKSCYCFIDVATGDILKAASWKTPAKHSRGTILDDDNGLKYLSEYGPAYLR